MRGENGKYIFGVCKVGERGQIVIPKEARDMYNIKAGDSLLLLGDKKGMALVKTEVFSAITEEILGDK
ncbi:MAG: AbrB/MazE/SpoVT family DNA-binding domain-containing protein [Clostridia bacterium]|nr:AbrB/MazE/SpoVT family DNA-binding domain-containing protein [Clostridia bacterium]